MSRPPSRQTLHKVSLKYLPIVATLSLTSFPKCLTKQKAEAAPRSHRLGKHSTSYSLSESHSTQSSEMPCGGHLCPGLTVHLARLFDLRHVPLPHIHTQQRKTKHKSRKRKRRSPGQTANQHLGEPETEWKHRATSRLTPQACWFRNKAGEAVITVPWDREE